MVKEGEIFSFMMFHTKVRKENKIIYLVSYSDAGERKENILFVK